LYELAYTVAAGDTAIAPGTLQVTIILTDPAGNVGNTYSILEPNNLEVYTALPEAALAGTTQICEGEEAELTVSLIGRAPWSFELNDGTTTNEYTSISSSEYKITVNPVQTTTYQISSVTDVNGVENSSSGNVRITVNEQADVEITGLAMGYHVEADPVKLEASAPGGTFSGPGVHIATGYFYPDLADTIDSPHTITYTYENGNGCITIASKQVYVMAVESAILMPDNPVCASGDPFFVGVLYVPGTTGSFSLLNSASEPVPGLTDHGDNTATIDPALLISGDYTIEYQYLDEGIPDLRKVFSAESVSQPQILNLNESSYCQNIDPFELESNVVNAVFEGPGVTGNIYDGFIFNPDEADPGNVAITCTAISENGCSASVQDSVAIIAVPEVKFGVQSVCLPQGGEIASFDNQTIEMPVIESWNWDFGDVGSGEDNYSNLADPTHQYQLPGQKKITLTATTSEGCMDIYELDTLIDSRPVADFTWISDCFKDGSSVEFLNRTTTGSGSVDTIIWTFMSGSGEIIGMTGSESVTDTVVFPFESADSYLVDMYTLNEGGCSSELTKELILRPIIQLDSEGYHESFDETKGMWTISSEDQVASWVWDEPDFNGFNQVSGDKAWFTQLPTGVPGYNEDSWIQSPCFDFSELDRPLIKLDVMKSFTPYINGAVLQYRDVMEEGWKTLGEETPGISWYNADNIYNQPGGSSIGWGLDLFTPDTEWNTAVHDLDPLAGKPNVALRVAIATNGRQGLDNQGFAFDNVVIVERSKLSLLEHFTNISDDTSGFADDIIDEFGMRHSKDVINLHYHMDSPGFDPMYENNPAPSSNRGYWFYGIPRIPYSVLDGGMQSYHRYDYSGLMDNTMDEHLLLSSLELPAFDIDLKVYWFESSLEANATVTCLADRFDENIDLYLVVFETSVTAYTGRNGDTHFRNVVLDMLPTPAGELLGGNWRKGNSEVRTNSWTYKPYVENINELAVAAFVQDRYTHKILQAAVEYKDKTVGNQDAVPEMGGLNIYPNPVYGTVFVNLGSSTEYPGSIELLDMNGKVVLAEPVPVGQLEFQLDIVQLTRGMYILRWIESDQIKGVSKIVKIR